MRLFFSCLFLLAFSGCATVFRGYEAEVNIHNPPDSLRVFTSDGLELPTYYGKTKKAIVRDQEEGRPLLVNVIDSTYRTIRLRSNRDYILLLKSEDSDRRVPAYAKLNGWYFTLDLLCGGIPWIVDATTGCWNYYDIIEFGKKIQP